MLREFAIEFAKEYIPREVKRQLRMRRMDQLDGKTPLDLLIEFLEGIGQENLRFAVESGITLWDMIPPDFRELAHNDNSRISSILRSLPEDLVGIGVYEAIREERPELAEVITLDWLAESFRKYKSGQL
jgi:hypothetical protein